MRSMASWLAPIMLVAAALVLSFGAYRMASEAWDGVVAYESPYLAADLPAATAGPVVSSRVVLVIVDGLRLDASRRMSSLEALRDYGAELTLVAPQPSLSYPNWTTIVSGTTQDHHGVVTNWYEGAVGVETVLDTALERGTGLVVVGPSDIATLYPAALRADGSYFEEWSDEYLSGRFVDRALELVADVRPRLVVLHLPDIDEAGHDFGGADPRYLDAVAKVDADLRRLVEALQDGRTTFVIVADHGHTDRGGHGGWEPDVVRVPGVIAGQGARALQAEAYLEDIAPTVAVLAGIAVPRMATGRVLESAIASSSPQGLRYASEQRRRAVSAFAAIAESGAAGRVEATRGTTSADRAAGVLEAARDRRLASDRWNRRFGPGVWIAVAAGAFLVVVALASWRALLAALGGSVAYYAVYNALFFGLHRNLWSLSAFNSEELIDAWMNTRLAEAATAGIVAAVVAGSLYPLLRHRPRGPHGRYLAGWLALGPLAVVSTQATLALQIAWFLWAWGLTPTWRLPDLMWGFKFDLDLVQVTALGAAAAAAPLLSYVVGRYHPKVRKQTAGEA